ncbi:kelch-like protein 10 [Mizuhopecten yessoensis]|uniref:Kelch-like protein 10 n=2 Tax=Mizuhopecten yessoensis TaxID=6573 RepID=A0A210QRR8_MIZYE|nr:kelch-like protein 10 [Mizuhopecten yessoensis]OWF51388.1 Kelch-like protein 10 [Mizuhopecten yessoensis]
MEFEEYSENTKGNELGKRFSSQSCNVFDELRRFQQLCDAVIKVENEEFPIHRAIMSASSPYFRALFTNALDAVDKREIEIPGVTAEIMHIIIDYAYTRRAKIDKNNIESLLPAADQFLVHGLVRRCCDFLARELEPENCIGIYKFARTYFCLDLERIAYRYLMHNINDVMNGSAEYLNLDLTEVCEILSSDDLNVNSEEITFLAVLLWIDRDPTNRKSHIADLLRTIRLGLLSTQYFVEHVKSHPFVMGNEQCKPIIIDTLKFLYDLDMVEERDLDMANPLARPRIPHDVMFAVGGWTNRSPICTVETYDTRADRWIICSKNDDTPRAYHGTVTIDLKIYVIGGFDGVDCFNSVKCFDAVTKIWSEAGPMISKRCYVSTTVLRGCIYAIGGFDGHVRLNTAERYFPGRNQWMNIAPMNHQRSDASATTLHEKIYICGGFNGEECLNSTEYYDPYANQWTCFAPMRSRRSGLGVKAYGDQIYAVGGFNGISRMSTAERYNPFTDRWESILAMYSPRSNFGVEVIDDMLFVIGGFDGVSTTQAVECFDKKSNEWFDTTEMNARRSALSACVITGLPNTQDYTYKEYIATKQTVQIQDGNIENESSFSF